MENENVISILQEAVREAINAAANEEIKKHRESFEREMLRTKRQIVNQLTESIQILVESNPFLGEYVIQIHLNAKERR